MTLKIPIPPGYTQGYTQNTHLPEIMRLLTTKARKRETARATKYYEVRRNGNIKTKKDAKLKKETPHQTEVRELKEKNTTQRKKITLLNKKIKALTAEIALMKKTGSFQKDTPIDKRKSDVFNRFSQVDVL